MNAKNCHRTKTSKTAVKKQPHTQSVYDDDNIPEIDTARFTQAEPLPESFRPRKDGPGGE